MLAGAVTAAAALWWRTHPSACPYGQRFWMQAPHPFITCPRLRQALSSAPGESILEVGPGTGYYTLPVAEWIGPDGTVEILDIQREMLDHTLARAHERVSTTSTDGGRCLRSRTSSAASMPHYS
jgi:protein-L-isoaspartate O-methyltransferase